MLLSPSPPTSSRSCVQLQLLLSFNAKTSLWGLIFPTFLVPIIKSIVKQWQRAGIALETGAIIGRTSILSVYSIIMSVFI